MSDVIIQYPDLIIRIAIAGAFPEEQNNRKVILSKFERIIDDTIKHISKYANVKYGYSDKQPTIQFLTASFLMDDNLLKALKQHYSGYRFMNATESIIGCRNGIRTSEEAPDGRNYTASAVPYGLIFSWMCDQTDYAVIINDDVSPLLRDFIKHCKYESVPAVNISTAAERHMLWSETSYYDSYDNDKLEKYLESLIKTESIHPEMEEKDKIFGHKLLWGNLYSRFMKKYKARMVNEIITKDTILEADHTINSVSETAEDTRKKLLGLFYEYDNIAIKYADKYRSSIYLRAVIPLFVTIVLAIGFYTETLLSPWQITIPGLHLHLWAVVAGIGFFLHALLNLYIYTLSENKTIHSWHRYFIDNRFIAETLRLAIHFIPFGIPVNYLFHLNKYGSKNKNNRNSIQKLRNILKGIGLPELNYNSSISSQCIDSLEELINNQIDYHKKTANQYAKVYNSLKRFGKVVFYIGFIFVLFRGGLQLYLSFHIPSGHLDNTDLQIIKSFANMLALLFPSWAAYFSSKQTLCNFEGLYNNDINMLEELSTIKQMINDEQQKESVTYTDMYYLSKDVNSIILGEVSEWYSQINSRKVTRL